jgi:hypothetical protein
MTHFHQAGPVSAAGIPIRPILTQRAHERARTSRAIFWAGSVCGLMDITAAFITWSFHGVSPFRILQAIASGLLGPSSFHGGWPTALLGAVCHFSIAFSAATVFYLASHKLLFLAHHPILSGIAYGVAVYLVMYWIVIPLSRLQPSPFSLSRTALAIVTHIFCVGLPISLLVHRFSSPN